MADYAEKGTRIDQKTEKTVFADNDNFVLTDSEDLDPLNRPRLKRGMWSTFKTNIQNFVTSLLGGYVTSSVTLTANKILLGNGTKDVKLATQGIADLVLASALENTPTDSTAKVTTSKYLYDNLLPIFTEWNSSFTPIVTSLIGTLTSASATCRYKKIGKYVTGTMKITITNNGTGASAIIATLPFQPYVNSTFPIIGFGREYQATGAMLQSVAQDFSGTYKATIFRYDNTYPGGTGYVLNINFAYETV